MPQYQPITQRIEKLSIPEPNSGCWLWLGSISRDGYGKLSGGRDDPGESLAHRASYKVQKKPDTTSARIASTAALILGAKQFSGGLCVYSGRRWHVIRVEDILAMAGSLVNQSADHAALKAGKIPKGHRRIKLHNPVLRRMLHK